MKLMGSNNKGKHGALRHEGDSPYTTNPVERDDSIRATRIDSDAGEKTASASLPDEQEVFSGKKRRSRLRVAAIVLGCLVLLCGAAYAAFHIWLEAPNPDDDTGLLTFGTPTPGPNASPGASATPRPTDSSTGTGRKPGTYTFVALGKDEVGMNTDTIMVGKLDVNEGTLNICSIPRDTMVNVPWSQRKVNATYVYSSWYHDNGSLEGDLDMTKTYMADLLGFEPDKYILVEIKAFREMVDAVGGITYNVPRDMYYDDPGQNLHIAISAGEKLLDGKNALDVVRFRVGNNNSGYADGDLGRINQQQDFLIVAAKQMLTLGNIPNLPKLFQIITDNLKTDLTDNNLAFYAAEFLKLDGEDITFVTAPVNAGFTIFNQYYASLELEEWLAVVNEYLNPFYEEVTAANVNILLSDDGWTFTSTTGQVPARDSFWQPS